ncbi:MAG TPA: S8 family serine peptidase, partial [Candidatus Polarisedimenticolaceae bacterium]|nr:S8 family serine peptidase [Candidatus Polarisedimenticolaceae bacterium]
MRSRFGRAAAMVVRLALCLVAGTVFAGGAVEPKQLRLGVGSFDPLTGELPLLPHLRLDAAPSHGYYLLQLTGERDDVVTSRLRELAVTPLDYVPDDAWVFRASPATIAALRAEPWVRWVGPLQPGWKLSPRLGEVPPRATIDLHHGEATEAASERLAALEIDVLAVHRFGDTRRLTVAATRSQLERAAHIDAVSWIAPVAELTLRNDRSSWVVQSFEPGVRSIWERGLHGEGQIIGHIDGPIYYKSCFFIDLFEEVPGNGHRKIVSYRGNGIGPEEHGTHTAGTVAGDPSPVGGGVGSAGIAYRARLSHTDLSLIGTDPSILYGFLEQAHADGARVHTNSWGDDDNNSYTPLVRDLDLFAYEHEDSLLVFAGSNSPWARSPENAKNVLAVGASGNGADADAFCSGGSGPTIDGRRKPEIFAPGCGVVSALHRTLCDTVSGTGTSMAAPAIAGAAALARQYFEQGWYPEGRPNPTDARPPSAALIKAVLLNSAANMLGVDGYPTDQEGWGRVLLEDALYFAGDPRRLVVLGDVRNGLGLASGVSDHLALEVTGSSEPLELTLVYTEPPAALMAQVATVNDLDLVVRSPGGRSYFGNVFDPEQGWSVAGGEADRLNNVEVIRIESPAPGRWSVRVTGASVNQGLQGYALIATGEV